MSDGSNLFLFLGRFHPVLVHLPIGILAVLGILELVARSNKHKHAADSAGYLLSIAMPLAALASWLGWLLSREGGYDPVLVRNHLWAGVATTLLSAACAAFFYFNLKKAYRFTLLVTIILLAVTSHWGGSLTHGKDHLVRYAPDFLKNIFPRHGKAVTTAPSPAEAPGRTEPDYSSRVQPVLDKYCVSCHGPEKAKGDLRMDSFELLSSHSGKRPAVVPGEAANSEMIIRLKLPAEDEDHMPPEGKPQPSAQEIALLEQWINAGASNSFALPR